MHLLEYALLGVALSMDAFAAAICQGLSMGKHRLGQGLVVALLFGGFQALMPYLGWILGGRFASQVEAFDHWVAFVLLGYLGVQMIRQSTQPEKSHNGTLDLGQVFGLALATSIDAFAVGVSFAFLHVDILPAVTMIGCITFVLSWLGVVAGHALGQHWRAKALWSGGVILCLLGTSILIEHLRLG